MLFMVDAIIAFQVMSQSSLMHRWAVRAAPIAKPWLPDHVTMLTRQAELSLLSGDFDHLDDDGGAPLPAKEVSHKILLIWSFCHMSQLMTEQYRHWPG